MSSGLDEDGLLRRQSEDGLVDNFEQCSKAPFHGAAANSTDDKNKQKSIWRGTPPFTI